VRVQLVCIPSNDTAFAAHANDALLRVGAWLGPAAVAEELQRQLQEHYPGAVVRPREALADVGMDRQIVWYVTNRAYRSRISASVEVPAPRDFVFHAYVERVPEWQTAVALREIRRTPGLIGSEWGGTWEFLGRRANGVFRLVEADPPHAVRFEVTGMGARVWYDTSFTPSAAGTIVRVVGDYDLPEGILPKIVDRLFVERGIQRQIDNAHLALVELCRRQMEIRAAG
jgi:hypothetical protein